MSSKIFASLGAILVVGVVACSTDETTTGSGGTTSATGAQGAAGPGGAGPGGAGPGGAGGTASVGPGGAGPGGAGPGGAGPGGAGPGGAGGGGGGGPCQTCAEVITDGLTNLCPDSKVIYDAFTQCICVDNCPDADECQMTCMNGTIDNNCQQCIQQQCQQEFDDCANDAP